MGRYLAWLNETRGLDLRSYDDAWRWSVDEPGRFWRSVWDHFEVIAHLPPRDSLAGGAMPGAHWFPGATLSYAEHALRLPGRGGRRRRGHRAVADPRRDRADRRGAPRPGRPVPGRARCDSAWGAAIGSPRSCRTSPRRSSRSSRRRASARSGRRARRSSAFERSSTGSARSSRRCSSRSTATATATRQIDRRTELAEIRAALPSLKSTVVLPYLDPAAAAGIPDAIAWADLLAETAPARVRAGAVRPPAVHPVLVRHDRAAEADRPRPRRDHPRAPQGARAAHGPRPGRSLPAGSRRPAG